VALRVCHSYTPSVAIPSSQVPPLGLGETALELSHRACAALHHAIQHAAARAAPTGVIIVSHAGVVRWWNTERARVCVYVVGVGVGVPGAA